MKKLIIATSLSVLSAMAADAPKPATPPADPLKEMREGLLRVQRDFMIAKADVDATPEGQRLSVAGKNMQDRYNGAGAACQTIGKIFDPPSVLCVEKPKEEAKATPIAPAK